MPLRIARKRPALPVILHALPERPHIQSTRCENTHANRIIMPTTSSRKLGPSNVSSGGPTHTIDIDCSLM